MKSCLKYDDWQKVQIIQNIQMDYKKVECLFNVLSYPNHLESWEKYNDWQKSTTSQKYLNW